MGASIAPTTATVRLSRAKLAGTEIRDVLPRQRIDRRKIAAHRRAIRMARISDGTKSTARNVIRIVGLTPEAGRDLAFHSLQGFDVEAVPA